MLSFAAALLFFPTDLSRSAQLSHLGEWIMPLLNVFGERKNLCEIQGRLEIWNDQVHRRLLDIYKALCERARVRRLWAQRIMVARVINSLSQTCRLRSLQQSFRRATLYAIINHQVLRLALKPQNAVKLQHQHTHAKRLRDGQGQTCSKILYKKITNHKLWSFYVCS